MFSVDSKDLSPTSITERGRGIKVCQFDLRTADFEQLVQIVRRRVWPDCTLWFVDSIAAYDFVNPFVMVQAKTRNRRFHAVIEDEIALCQDRLMDEFGLEPDDFDLNLNTKVFPEQMSTPDRQERIDLIWTGVLRKKGVIQSADSWLDDGGLVKFG